MPEIIHDSENVARLVANEWIVNGRLQLSAFALRSGETYISVNRVLAASYQKDIISFVSTHPSYSKAKGYYNCALLSVKEIKSIEVVIDTDVLSVSVEVEPRSRNIASHAGIFVRHNGTNIKNGSHIIIHKQQLGISADDILLDVRMSLLRIAVLEEKSLQITMLTSVMLLSL
ncbi:MAG: hypothetical protein K6F33_10030 [Bacteroidales bacterium]|nr:hypothetical protein [Bacteroidales bacterium]